MHDNIPLGEIPLLILLYWVEQYTSPKLVSPRTYKCDFIWKQGLRRCNQVKRSPLVGPLNSNMTDCPYKTHSERRNSHVKMEAEIGVMQYKPRNTRITNTTRSAGRAKEGVFPRILRSMALLRFRILAHKTMRK